MKGYFEDELTFENLFLAAILEFVVLESLHNDNPLAALLSPLFVLTEVKLHGSGS